MEPVPETFELLTANMAGIRYKNITLLNCAASSSTGFRGFTFPKFDSGLDNYYMAHITNKEEDFSALCLPVDNFDFSRLVKFVRIDVEGHEYSVLLGMKKLLKRDHPIVITEGFDKDVEFFMTEIGYKIENYEGSPNRIFYYDYGLTHLKRY